MRTLVLELTLAVGLGLPAVSRAQTNLVLVPSISVGAVSDDNIFTTVKRTGDQTTLLTPGVEGAVATPRASLLGVYSFDMLRSADFSALNDLEARRRGSLAATYRWNPRLEFNVNSHYDRSDESGELNFETGFLLPRTRATRWELGPTIGYKVNPVVTVRGTYDWVQESLEHVMVADEHIGRFLITRQLSGRTSISAGYIGRHFINDADTQTSHAAIAGPAYEIGPFTMLTLQGGPRLSSNGRLAPELLASLVRRTPGLFAFAVDYWRGESIILGVVGPVEVTSATGRGSWPIKRNIEVGGATGFFRTEAAIQGQARVYHTEAVAAWTPKPFSTISALYGADFQHGDIRTRFLNGQDVVRHVFEVRLTVAPRLSRTTQRAGPIAPLTGAPKGGNRD